MDGFVGPSGYVGADIGTYAGDPVKRLRDMPVIGRAREGPDRCGAGSSGGSSGGAGEQVLEQLDGGVDLPGEQHRGQLRL